MEHARAVVFDLYGTLIQFDQKPFISDMVAAFKCQVGRRKLSMSLRTLLVTSYDDDYQGLKKWCEAVGVESPSEADLVRCQEILDKHLNQITLIEGAIETLSFLKKRGLKLAILSNSAQAFSRVLPALELDKYFDHIFFSCDMGIAKPDPLAYQTVCEALGEPPENCIFVGDSLTNDYRGPKQAGLRAFHASGNSRQLEACPSPISELLWLDYGKDKEEPEPLIRVGQTFTLDAEAWRVASLLPFDLSQQGAHNLVLRLLAVNNAGQELVFFAKRFADPSSAHVEALAYSIVGALGFSDAKTVLLASSEPLLLISEVDGISWDHADIDDNIAKSAGSHCAIAYIIANADLRPRNMLLSHDSNGKRKLNVLDLEHCFFDRALDTTLLPNPFDPKSIDSLTDKIDEYTKKRALSDRAVRRTRKEFIADSLNANTKGTQFQEGWHQVFSIANEKSGKIYKTLLERIKTGPTIVIGTKSYRRAMCEVDINDIMERISHDSVAHFERLYGR